MTALRTRPASRGAKRRRWPFLLVPVAILAAAATALFEWSGATLSGDPSALARVKVEAFAGTLQSARATGPDGRAIALAEDHGQLTPRRKVAQGERIAVDVVLKRPGWDAWLLGARRTERLTVTAPVAKVASQWVTVPAGRPVTIAFDAPAATVVYRTAGTRRAHRLAAAAGRTTASLPAGAPAGTVEVAVAARPWERVGTSTAVHWFPSAKHPVALVSPPPGARLAPGDPLRLEFSVPTSKALGRSTPKLTPDVPGRWHHTDAHTLTFTPSGYGAPPGTHVKVALPHPLAVADAAGRRPRTAREIAWTVPPVSILRLQQLLAQEGYEPLDWTPAAGATPARTQRAQASAAVDPPAGHFAWRYPNTPRELKRQWDAGSVSEITRGAVMMFQDEHGLEVDGFAGPRLWRALMDDAVAGKRRTEGYSYVYVHRDLPQLLTLWHNGHTVLTSPGNTGVPAAPTELGTFPVFEHVKSTTMSGTNPDGSTYNDPGVKYVSYFNGGDALHAFNRASFGTPQSLGCVELPLASAKTVWPYTPIGTLVTIEH